MLHSFVVTHWRHSPVDVPAVDGVEMAFDSRSSNAACRVRANRRKTKRAGLENSALSNLTSITCDLLRLSSSCLLISAWLICQVQQHGFYPACIPAMENCVRAFFFQRWTRTYSSSFTQRKHCLSHFICHSIGFQQAEGTRKYILIEEIGRYRAEIARDLDVLRELSQECFSELIKVLQLPSL